MDWCTLLCLGLAVYMIVQLLRLAVSDCDLTLQWACWFGKTPEHLARKVVWVTGASSGIGEHLVYALAKGGCRLVLTARREPELQRVKKKCLEFGKLTDEDILVLPMDMVDLSSHKTAVQKVLDKFKQIDILVNNAGKSQRAEIQKIHIDVDRDMVELNVMSVISLTKAVLPHMLERGEGHLAIMSSVAGKVGVPGSASYCLTKHAVMGFFDSARVELFSQNIKVTDLIPGPVFSNLLQVAATDEPGKVVGQDMNPKDNRMATSRCGYLCAVALANQIPEAWMSRQPILFFMYIGQYTPVFGKWLADRIGVKGIQKMREGR